MSDEILKRDQNFITVLGGVTNDSDKDITMLRVDPITKRLLVSADVSGVAVTSLNGLTGDVVLAAGTNITLTPVGNTITIAASDSAVAIGGTVTGGTTGSVLFVGPGATLAQDNANFFWDDTNNRLGLGTNTPAFGLDTALTARFQNTARFTGSVTEAAQGVDRIDIGVESGTPRMVFEDTGHTIWQVDNLAGQFRWFIPGAEKMILENTGTAAALTLINGSTDTIHLNTAGGSYISKGLRINGSVSNDTFIGQYGNTISALYDYNADDGALWVNFTGYQDGITRFRDFSIGDGKNNSIVYVDGSSGNVGIGTTSPQGKLDVNGKIVIGPSTTGVAQSIINPDSAANFAVVSFYPNSGTNVNSTFSVVPRGTGQAGNVAQFSIFGTDLIADGANYEFANLRATGTSFNLATGAVGTGTLRPLMLSAGYGTLTNENQLLLKTDGKIAMMTGNVGIGSIAPSEKLDVVGNGLFSGGVGSGATAPTGYGFYHYTNTASVSAAFQMRSAFSNVANTYFGNFGDWGTIFAHNRDPQSGAFVNAAASPNQNKAVDIIFGRLNSAAGSPARMFTLVNYPSGVETEWIGVDWSGNLTFGGPASFSGDVTVPDEVYGSAWNGSLEAPTKNAIYDFLNPVIDTNGYSRPKSSSDASAPNNSVYYSTDASKLVYKDAGGVVNALY